MRVDEIMSSPVVTAMPDDLLASVARAMITDRRGSVVVVDDEGTVEGIVTRSDLQVATRRLPLGYPDVRAPSLLDAFVADEEQLQRAYRRAGGRPVREVMSRPVVTVAPGASVWQATEIMLAERIGHLPVVDEGRPVGMLSRLDLLTCMIAP